MQTIQETQNRFAPAADTPCTGRILIIQENGRYERNRQFRECFCLQRAFEHLGVSADVWGKGHPGSDRPFDDVIGDYNAVISLENYDAGWHPDLSRVEIPTAFWCIDAHMGVERYLEFVRTHRFDIVFNATEAFVEHFKGMTGESLWLPNAYDGFLIDKLFNVPKTIPLGFCGNTVNRQRWIDHLKKRWGLHHDQMVIGPDMVQAINSYRIHWNHNIANDINYRTFETLGCATLLLTNYTPGLDKLFTPGEHLVVYQDQKDLDEKIEYYLNHREKCGKIAREGYRHVTKHHTYVQRAKIILSALGIPGRPATAACHPKKFSQKLFLDKPFAATELKSADSEAQLNNLPIAIVTETMNYISGGVRCIAEVLNRLKRRGYDVACYVTQPDLRCEWLNVDFSILPASRLGDFKGIAISPYSPTAKMVARCNAVAKFYWVHSYEPHFPELTGRSDSWRVMSENSYRLDELQYFAVSSYVKMILELIYKRRTLSPLVPGGVDTALFTPGKKAGRPLRLMFLSREHGFRGAGDMVKALQIVRQHGIELEVWVMGQPLDMRNIAHRLVAPLPQQEFADLLATMDIFVHASHFEGLPLPPLEAMACRCAVIATFVGASDYLLDGYNALVVPPGRPDKIAAGLLRLAGDEKLRNKLGQGGEETVKGGYTWEHTVDRLLEALAEGLESARPPIGAVQFDGSTRRRKVDGAPVGSAYPSAADPTVSLSVTSSYRVSAIVSTYNAERFMRGCLEDLLAQTIGERLEIIVVDSGSRENEGAVVRQFQKKFNNIRYIRTTHRESLYAAWNRGIRAASGKYITSANTDDRHAAHAFERMARRLDERSDIALVYANVWVTETENETFERFTPVGRLKWKDFDPRQLIDGCFIGPQPMWRKSMHSQYGYFDESLESAGDWEFWLRISRKETFLHIDEFLGLYLKAPTSIEHRNRQISVQEARRIHRQYAGSVHSPAGAAAPGAAGE